jgi:hypothetical protein
VHQPDLGGQKNKQQGALDQELQFELKTDPVPKVKSMLHPGTPC